jgi:hypothetical protein
VSKEGALHGLICVACAGVDMAAWRAGTISADDAAIIISLLLYNTVPIATASVDPAVGQPSKLLAAGTANSQLGVVLSSSLPLTFSQSGSSVRCQPLHVALIAPSCLREQASEAPESGRVRTVRHLSSAILLQLRSLPLCER